MSVGGIVSSVYQTRQNQKNLKSTIEKSDVVQVQREDGTCEVVDSGDLVPGDVIVIPPSGCELSCDAVLVSGSAIGKHHNQSQMSVATSAAENQLHKNANSIVT